MEETLTDKSYKNYIPANSESNEKISQSLINPYRKKNIFLLKNYYNDTYKLENQALRNSFGKMIRSKNDTSPKFSFPKEKRFYQVFKKDDINYYTKAFNKIKEQRDNTNITHRILQRRNFKTPENYFDKIKTVNLFKGVKTPTDYLYFPPPTNIYKHPFLPKFSFGKGLREFQKPIKLYEHYKVGYNKKTDGEQIERKWRKRIVGGNIGLEDRFIEDKKFVYESLTPGPGRYNPNYIFFKYNQSKYGYMGIKLKDDQSTIYTDRPKNISLDAKNIKHLIGNKYSNNNNITSTNPDKNIRYKLFKIRQKSNKHDTNKTQFKILRNSLENKINNQNIERANITFNK